MGSLDMETYAAFKTLYTANSTLTGLTVGGFIRFDYRERTRPYNRIEYRLVADNDESGSGTTIRRCTVHLTAFVKRERAYGTGDTPEATGELEQIERQMETTFGGVLPTGTAWGFSTTSQPRWSSQTATDDHIERTMTVAFVGAKS